MALDLSGNELRLAPLFPPADEAPPPGDPMDSSDDEDAVPDPAPAAARLREAEEGAAAVATDKGDPAWSVCSAQERRRAANAASARLRRSTPAHRKAVKVLRAVPPLTGPPSEKNSSAQRIQYNGALVGSAMMAPVARMLE